MKGERKMSQRKDKKGKGRNLKTGESQRKDGRYAYKYTDIFGKQKFIYSWRLVETDATPKGKKQDLSLREKERQILRDLEDGVDTSNKDMTVYELVEKYLSYKIYAKPHTKSSHEEIKKRIKNEEFGTIKIENVKISTAKAFVITLHNQGLSYNTIKLIISIVKSAFNMAVNDDMIRKNPFNFKLTEVIKNLSAGRKALTEDEERKLLDFIRNDKKLSKYYDEVIILLRTGIRASELCGLTWHDIDFENKTINIDRQLMKTDKDHYMITTPKTKNGIRKIPMSKEVYNAFQNVMNKNKESIITVDDINDFVFIANGCRPKTYSNYNELFKMIRREYNREHEEKISVSAHILRHTFCTRMANAGMNPKSLQYIMGHSNIAITLNVYSHATYENAFNEMSKIYEI